MTDSKPVLVTDGGTCESGTDRVEEFFDYEYPSECPNCGGPVGFAERQSDAQQLLLCKGACGEWREIDL